MEAISGQVALLRRHFPCSVAWGMNPKKICQLSWRKGMVVHPRFWLPFRCLTGVLQYGFNLNHIYGGPGDWHYLKAVRGHPTVLTVAVKGTTTEPALLEKVDRFIVEWRRDVEWLERQGISRRRITVIPPPVDLRRFHLMPPPPGPFQVLFASSPDSVPGLQERGVDVILDAASLRPDYRFMLLWRPWGDSLETLQSWIKERQINNVRVIREAMVGMEEVYGSAHVTVAPFRCSNNTKAMPNSLLESLACGRPIITTREISFSEDVWECGAGRCIVSVDGPELASALDYIREQWTANSVSARQFAQTHFHAGEFVAAHEALYSELSN